MLHFNKVRRRRATAPSLLGIPVVTAVLLLAGYIGCSDDDADGPPTRPTVEPVFGEVIDARTTPVDLTDALLSGPVALYFWEPWCSPCTQQVSVLADLYDQIEADGIRIIGLTVDANLDSLVARHQEDSIGWTDIIITSAVWDLYSIHGIPTLQFHCSDTAVWRQFEGFFGAYTTAEWFTMFADSCGT